MRRIFTAASALVFLSAHVAAQTQTVRLVGTVHDGSGASIPNAMVTATQEQTSQTAETATNTSGEYVFPSLQPGAYTLTVEAPGFRKALVNALLLDAGANLSQAVTLEVGQVSETLEVRADAVSVQGTDAQLNQSVTLSDICDAAATRPHSNYAGGLPARRPLADSQWKNEAGARKVRPHLFADRNFIGLANEFQVIIPSRAGTIVIIERGFMTTVKLIVAYPPPTDAETFEKVYNEEHVPLAVAKLDGKTRMVATRIIGSPQGAPMFYRVAEVHFSSLAALEACAGSSGGQEVLRHATKISSGGPPVIMIAEEESFAF